MDATRGMILASLSLILLAASVVSWSREQEGDVVADAGKGIAAHAKHVNLRVLPADIGVPQLGKLMRRYERELGVGCSYCHVQDRDTGKFDYASDENAKKEIARVMIAMLDDINNRHLASLGGDTRYAAQVGCGSCHQGRANPPAFEAR